MITLTALDQLLSRPCILQQILIPLTSFAWGLHPPICMQLPQELHLNSDLSEIYCE